MRLFILIGCVALVSCCSVARDFRTGRSKLQEMKAIAIPVFPEAVEVSAKERSAGGTAILGKSYKSGASYEDLKNFYLQKLLSQGWKFHRDRPLPTFNAPNPGRLLEFCMGDFSLTLQFAGRDAGYAWDYAIDMIWPGKDVCDSTSSK